MVDVATQGLKFQLGLETVPGTAVAATKRMMAMAIDFDPEMETDQFAPSGNIVPSSSSLIQEWATGDLEGVLTYTEAIYAWIMAFGLPTTAVAAPTVGADTSLLARDWIWSIGGAAELTPKSATLERGSSAYGMRVANAVLNDLGFSWSRTDRIELTGAILALPIEKPYTPTAIASNATVPLVRVLPTQINVFLDDTYSAISGASPTKALRTFSGAFSLSGLYAPVWAVNADKPSYDGLVRAMPDSDAELLLMADANGLAFLDTARAGQTRYMKFQAVGPVIDTVGATTFRHLVEMILPIQIKDVDSFENADGIYAIPWTFQPVDDGVNPAMWFRFRNTLTAP